MTSHLSPEQLVALLHGALSASERDDARRHLAACAACAEALARDAALDEILWETRAALPARAVAFAARRPARSVRRWVTGALGLAGVAVLGYAGVSGFKS